MLRREFGFSPPYNCLPIKWYDTQYVSDFGTKCTPILYLPLSVSSYLCPPIICIIEGRAQWKRSKRLKSQKNHFNCSLLLSYIWPKEPDVTQRHFNDYMSFFWFSKQLSQCKCPDTIEPETPWRTWKLGIYIFSLGIFGGGKNNNSAMGKDILKRYQNPVTISAFLTLEIHILHFISNPFHCHFSWLPGCHSSSWGGRSRRLLSTQERRLEIWF